MFDQRAVAKFRLLDLFEQMILFDEHSDIIHNVTKSRNDLFIELLFRITQKAQTPLNDLHIQRQKRGQTGWKE
jgi:hypothetical protein